MTHNSAGWKVQDWASGEDLRLLPLLQEDKGEPVCAETTGKERQQAGASVRFSQQPVLMEAVSDNSLTPERRALHHSWGIHPRPKHLRPGSTSNTEIRFHHEIWWSQTNRIQTIAAHLTSTLESTMGEGLKARQISIGCRHQKKLGVAIRLSSLPLSHSFPFNSKIVFRILLGYFAQLWPRKDWCALRSFLCDEAFQGFLGEAQCSNFWRPGPARVGLWILFVCSWDLALNSRCCSLEWRVSPLLL